MQNFYVYLIYFDSYGQKKGLRWKSLPVLIQYPMKNHTINATTCFLVCRIEKKSK